MGERLIKNNQPKKEIKNLGSSLQLMVIIKVINQDGWTCPTDFSDGRVQRPWHHAPYLGG